MKEKSIAHNFVMNFILTVSNIVFPLITFPYASRILLADGMGKIAFSASVITYTNIIVQLGIPNYGIRECAKCRDDKEKLSKTVQELMIIQGIMLGVCIVSLGVMLFTIPKFEAYRTLIIIYGIGMVLSTLGINWFFQAIEEYGFITSRNIIVRLTCVVLMFFLVRDKKDIVNYALLLGIGYQFGGIINLLYSAKYIFWKRYKNYNLKKHIRPIVNFFGMSVAASIYTNLDIVMLGIMTNDTVTGYYQASVSAKNILVSLTVAFGTVLLPKLSFLVKEKRMKEVSAYLKLGLQFALVSSMAFVVFFIVEAKLTISILSGTSFIPATATMQVIMLTVLLIGISNILGTQGLIPLGMEAAMLKAQILGAGTDFLLNIILIRLYDSVGAAVATVCAECIVAVVVIGYIVREIKGGSINNIFSGLCREIGKIICALVGAFGVCMCIDSVCRFDFIVRFIVDAIGFFGTYGLLLLLFREEFVLGMLRQMGKGIRNFMKFGG